jgi:hypothetical protein
LADLHPQAIDIVLLAGVPEPEGNDPAWANDRAWGVQLLVAGDNSYRFKHWLSDRAQPLTVQQALRMADRECKARKVPRA